MESDAILIQSLITFGHYPDYTWFLCHPILLFSGIFVISLIQSSNLETVKAANYALFESHLRWEI